VAQAVETINGADKDELYKQLVAVAKRKTAEADVTLDERGKPVEEDEEDFGANVLIVEPGAESPGAALAAGLSAAAPAATSEKPKKRK
jgi:DNA topoisomerase-6 subunit B